jgi:hypothetical protein
MRVPVEISTAEISSFGLNGFCTQMMSAKAGDNGERSKAVRPDGRNGTPDIAMIGNFGLRRGPRVI